MLELECYSLLVLKPGVVRVASFMCCMSSAGTGKTAIMRDKLKNMDAETMTFSTINMNSFSDAPSLQGTLEQPLEKKSGQYGVMSQGV